MTRSDSIWVKLMCVGWIARLCVQLCVRQVLKDLNNVFLYFLLLKLSLFLFQLVII